MRAAIGQELCGSDLEAKPLGPNNKVSFYKMPEPQRPLICVELCLITQVYYTVDSIGEGGGKDWKGGVGYVTRKMATEHIPPPSDDSLVLVCGPPPMYKALSGEKKSPKDQGDYGGSCNVAFLVVSVGLACCCKGLSCCLTLVWCAGELSGLLKTMGFTEQQVYKF